MFFYILLFSFLLSFPVSPSEGFTTPKTGDTSAKHFRPFRPALAAFKARSTSKERKQINLIFHPDRADKLATISDPKKIKETLRNKLKKHFTDEEVALAVAIYDKHYAQPKEKNLSHFFRDLYDEYNGSAEEVEVDDPATRFMKNPDQEFQLPAITSQDLETLIFDEEQEESFETMRDYLEWLTCSKTKYKPRDKSEIAKRINKYTHRSWGLKANETRTPACFAHEGKTSQEEDRSLCHEFARSGAKEMILTLPQAEPGFNPKKDYLEAKTLIQTIQKQSSDLSDEQASALINVLPRFAAQEFKKAINEKAQKKAWSPIKTRTLLQEALGVIPPSEGTKVTKDEQEEAQSLLKEAWSKGFQEYCKYLKHSCSRSPRGKKLKLEEVIVSDHLTQEEQELFALQCELLAGKREHISDDRIAQIQNSAVEKLGRQAGNWNFTEKSLLLANIGFWIFEPIIYAAYELDDEKRKVMLTLGKKKVEKEEEIKKLESWWNILMGTFKRKWAVRLPLLVLWFISLRNSNHYSKRFNHVKDIAHNLEDGTLKQHTTSHTDER